MGVIKSGWCTRTASNKSGRWTMRASNKSGWRTTTGKRDVRSDNDI